MAPKLEPVFTFRAYTARNNALNLNAIWNGAHRIIVPVVGGFLKGSGIDTEVVPGGADWILRDPSTNTSHIDVRAMVRTSAGQGLFLHYNGVLRFDEKAAACLSLSPEAKSTNFGDHYWFISPIIEASDPKYKWVEDTQWLGQGRFIVDEKGSGVEYEIYSVSN